MKKPTKKTAPTRDKKQTRKESPCLSKEMRAALKKVTAKRPKIVIDHILKHGYITTEELKETYGYNHPPRAARDVREQGIPLETFRVTGTGGRKIAAYRFDDLDNIKADKLGGRRAWPKQFKNNLITHYGTRCNICHTKLHPRYLQIDHRIPFEVAGNPSGEPAAANFMLLCRACNRAKSWSCEQCPNWQVDHAHNVCQTCYWASPENYTHIALQQIRRLDVTWTSDEIPDYDLLATASQQSQQKLPDFVKKILRRAMHDDTHDDTNPSSG